MECPRSHNSSLIVKELIKPVASLLTEFYDVNFTTGQAKSGICGLHRGLLAPDKKALMIFSMSTAESQVIHQQSPASSHRARTWQLGITFLAWFRAALPMEHRSTHVCLGRYTRVPHGTKQTQTTSLERDNLLFGILFRCLFKLLMIPLF